MEQEGATVYLQCGETNEVKTTIIQGRQSIVTCCMGFVATKLQPDIKCFYCAGGMQSC